MRASGPDHVLICFSHLRWGFVYQRPQHLISRAARDHLVYYLEEPVFERAENVPRLDRFPREDGVVVTVPVLAEGWSEDEAIEAQRRLLDGLLAGQGAEETTFWYYTPMALAFSDHQDSDLCVYDCMDELTAFRGAPPDLPKLERRLFERSDIVFTGGYSLFEVKRGEHRNVHAFPSSVDKAHFGRARAFAEAEPADQAGLARPRIGFFGVIDERMDLDLVDAVARLRPDWQFVMLGPVVKIDPATLPQRSNLHWLGSKAYAELPAYLAGWDLGFMPFALNESTRFISPTKTPEFLAAGIPVVSTPIADVVRPYGEMGLVEIAATAEEAVVRMEALMDRPQQPWLDRVDGYLRDLSWDLTWAGMSALMCKAAAARRPQPTVSRPVTAFATRGRPSRV